MWIYGYGSLMWRPDFEFEERSDATLQGFSRQLWQGSPDHRGTPAAPGRVVTLVADATAHCRGIAFRIDVQHQTNILVALDHREQGGYEREWVQIRLADGRDVQALTYIGWPHNPHFLGPVNEADMVRQIMSSTGPSGRNADYVSELGQQMRRLGQGNDPLAVFCAQFEG
ncbi:MAG: gamma-glutamylcyclotransferase [Gammaproteobacteria bacterium]